NWEALDGEIRRRHRDRGWAAAVMSKAGVEHVITDPYMNPLLDAPSELGSLYTSVARINSLALGWHPDVRDHNGNVGHELVHRLCALAGERGIPVQMHLGTALIRGSHPLNAAGLIERHPRTRFLLMHFAYPWSRDLLGMAFTYRNIWLDMTWSFMLSPSHCKLALHEA